MYLPTTKVAGRATDAAAIVANTTQTADPDLSVPVIAGTRIAFRAVLHVTSPAAADIDIGLVFPTGSTGIFFNAAAPSVPIAQNADLTVATDGAREVIVLEGTLLIGDESGDFGLSFAQTVSDAGSTIVHAGSHLVVTNLS